LVPRLALIGTCAIGASGFLAGPAAAINNYVTQPAVTGVSSLTPESAVLSGAVDTGGDPGVNFNASVAAPVSFGGLVITSNAILNGIPVGVGYYSTALFEADPMSDYIASGNQPGGATVTAPVEEVQTTTGLSGVSAEIGAYPAASGSGSPLKPGTKYVYWVVQQAGESDQATTVNEYSTTDLASWLDQAGAPGTIAANGFASSSNIVTSGAKENDYPAWVHGTGTYSGDPTDPTRVPGSIVNPDYACVLNSTIAANTNATWVAEVATGKVPLAAGSSMIPSGPAVPYGVAAAPSASGTFTATAAQQPAEQGPCVTFYGGNSTNFYTSPVGTFTTPPLGKIVVGAHGIVAGGRALVTITDRSVERGAGTIELSTKKGTVASGRFSVAAGATGVAKLKLSGETLRLLKKSKHLVVRVSVTSSTDQPSTGRTVTLG
jgi:hypothetical protein